MICCGGVFRIFYGCRYRQVAGSVGPGFRGAGSRIGRLGMGFVGRSWFFRLAGGAFVSMPDGRGCLGIGRLALAHPLDTGRCSLPSSGVRFCVRPPIKFWALLFGCGWTAGLVWLSSGGLWAIVPKVWRLGRFGYLSHSSVILTVRSR